MLTLYKLEVNEISFKKSRDLREWIFLKKVTEQLYIKLRQKLDNLTLLNANIFSAAAYVCVLVGERLSGISKDTIITKAWREFPMFS